MTMTVEHRFGSTWTEEKLGIVIKYLGFYTSALGDKFWKLTYIDAFAGTGSREYDDEDGQTISLEGSALRAIQTDPPFDEYIFIEKDALKASSLRKKLATTQARNPHVFKGDANEKLKEILASWNKAKQRGVVFLDPFAMAVEWETLNRIARTESLDLWLLVPFGAVARTLPRDGNIPSGWLEKLVRVLGEDPTPHLYEHQTQASLFPEEDEFAVDGERNIRRGGAKTLGRYLIRRLRSIFMGHVHSEVLVLRNSRNSPMFFLVFCLANPSPKAIGLAKKAVGDILRKHREEGGDVEGFGD